MKETAYRFTPDVIRAVVDSEKAGVYALGDVLNGKFVVAYVGRSDCSLQTRLLTHNYRYDYSYFIFRYTSNARDAFVLESQWWHDCRNAEPPLVNQIHPDSPSGIKLYCPYCSFSRDVDKILQSEIDIPQKLAS